MEQNELAMLDLLISEPPSALRRSFILYERSVNKSNIFEIGSDEFKEVPKFLQRMLKNGGYCLIFITSSMRQDWYERFCRCGYDEMSSLYTIVYEESTVQKRNECG